MSSHFRRERRDRSRFTPQTTKQTWVPKGTVVVNDTGSLDAASRLQNHRHQRSNLPDPPPFSRQRSGSRAGLARTRPDKEVILLTDPNVPQLVQEIQDKLMKGSIECMICYDMVRRSANIWSCSSCYSIFHLTCIKKWAQAPTSVDRNQASNWRCPSCQLVQLTSSKEILYRCFCGKRKDPPSDPYVTPHSCGDSCGKSLEKEFATAEMGRENSCLHVCVLQCHPGPCPPCKAFAPPRSCLCGKKMIRSRCFERKSDLSCEQRCVKLLNCGRHRCRKACHVGLCDPCQVQVNASCFCKQMVREVQRGTPWNEAQTEGTSSSKATGKQPEETEMVDD